LRDNIIYRLGLLEANGGPAVLNNNWGLLAHWHAAFYGKGGFLKWVTVPSFSMEDVMSKRNWLVEDNLVALYVALHEYKDLRFKLEDIQEIIPHKSFGMRIQNYIAIDTDGEKGLDAALKSPLFNELYGIFKDFSQKNFARLVNSILDVKSKINKR